VTMDAIKNLIKLAEKCDQKREYAKVLPIYSQAVDQAKKVGLQPAKSSSDILISRLQLPDASRALVYANKCIKEDATQVLPFILKSSAMASQGQHEDSALCIMSFLREFPLAHMSKEEETDLFDVMRSIRYYSFDFVKRSLFTGESPRYKDVFVIDSLGRGDFSSMTMFCAPEMQVLFKSISKCTLIIMEGVYHECDTLHLCRSMWKNSKSLA